MEGETTLVSTLVVDKETKGTIRFAEVETDDLPVLSTIYVPKFTLKRLGSPQTLRVTIEVVE